jgi:hypothetical protein
MTHRGGSKPVDASVSASFRLKKRENARRELESGVDDPHQQGRWSAWPAIAVGVAALSAMADGLFPGS